MNTGGPCTLRMWNIFAINVYIVRVVSEVFILFSLKLQGYPFSMPDSFPSIIITKGWPVSRKLRHALVGSTTTTTTYYKNFFMLWVWANLGPLLFLRTPHICWAKWSRICSNSKHSQDITVVTQWLKISQLCYISAMRWVRANPRPLRPTNMGGFSGTKVASDLL